MCVECIVVHKKPREGLNYARQAFDDWCCRRDHHDPPQRCPPKSGALPASRRQHRPQLVRRALPGAAHEAHQPKACGGCALKASDCKDHVGRAAAIRHPHGCFGQMRAGQKMRRTSRIASATHSLSPIFVVGSPRSRLASGEDRDLRCLMQRRRHSFGRLPLFPG